jgi:hypothetical protein
VWQLLEAKHTLGAAVAADPHWLTEIVLAFVAKNLGVLFPLVHEETVAALEAYIPECEDGKSLSVVIAHSDELTGD